MRHLIRLFALIALAALSMGCQHEATLSDDDAKRLPYAIGSQTRFIHDQSRPYDSVAGIDDGIRILITELWYPTEHVAVANGSHLRATYGDYVFRDRDLHRLMLTETTFFHLTPDSVRDGVSQAQIDAAIDELFERKRASYIDAPLAGAPEKLPVVVMSHGDAGSRYNMESACEYLAAHGYLVIAPEHTGNSPFSMTAWDPALAAAGDAALRAKMAPVLERFNEFGAYGSRDNYGQSYTPLVSDRDTVQSYQQMDRSLLQRVNDLRATLAELERMNSSGPFAGRLELERIGLMGRSYGGATTLVGLALEDRFTSGLAVVPPSMPDVRAALPPQALAPAGRESALLSADGPFTLADISKPTMLLSGAEDTLIIGLAAATAKAMGTSAPTPQNPHPILRSAYESTDAPVVWGLLADSNHGSFGVSGPYWWPQLKPHTQARHFAPGEQFELIEAQLAHRVQKEKALAFFDLTVRGDASARERLLANDFAAVGLTLEARNF